MYKPGSNPSLQDAILAEISAVLDTPLLCLDLESSFTKNGGDSLSSIRLQAAMRRRGIQISIGSILAATKILHLSEWNAPSPSHIENSSLVAANLHGTKGKHSKVRDQSTERSCGPLCIETAPKDEELSRRYPMTEMQMSLVHSTQRSPGRNVVAYFETHRPRYIPSIRNAWEKVLRSEAIFNMVFEVDESHGYMREGAKAPCVWDEMTVNTRSSYERELEDWLPVDNSIGSSFKLVNFRSTGEEGQSTIIWRVHHALVDGMSLALIRSKVQRVLAGEQIEAGPSFLDFSIRLRFIQLEAHESAVAFWARQQNASPHASTRLLLPAPPSRQTSRTTLLRQSYLRSNVERLAEYSKKLGVTLASLYYATWGLVVARFSDSDSISFGAVLSGRTVPIEGAHSIVGPMINTLPLYIHLDARTTVDEYLQTVFNSLVELMSFHWSIPSHGFSRNFSSAVSIRFEEPISTGTPFDPIKRPFSQVISDIAVQVEVEMCGRICLSYNTDSYDQFQMELMSSTFAKALDAIMDPRSTLSLCLESLVGPQEREELGRLGNWTSVLAKQGCIQEDLISIFERAADANPALIAVQNKSCLLTYADLHQQSSLVARHLSMFIAPGDVVCVHADGTVNWIIAIYAVLKAGATYCPLDRHLPDADRAMNFKTANAKMFLAGDTATVRPTWCQVCLSVQELLARKDIPPDLLRREPRPQSNAYICFTSGSTGKPKGVICRHEGLVAFQSDFRVRLCARPGWRIAQLMSPGFDGSIHEIFSTLSYGSTLVLKDDSRPFDHLKICDAAVLTPSVAKALGPAEFPDLQAVYLVGEVVPQSVCDEWALQRLLFNMYGPSEATCGATIKSLAAQSPVTLGVPNGSTRVYILDSQKRLVPRGVIGEIYLAGIQIAAGYVGQPDETSKKFFLDPITPECGGEYMYKTGDRAYWNECGELSFQGRADRQVKYRGFRIDLDDLEVRITEADSKCTATAVIIKDDSLIAFVQPTDLDLQEFKFQIHQHIPVYSVPNHVIAVDSFPTTPAGKLDYKALGSCTASELTSNATPTELENKVAAALKGVLGIPADTDISYDSSFNDLGGNSILALRLKHRLSRELKQHVSINVILESLTVRDLAEALTSVHRPNEAHAGLVLGDHRVSPIESDWWHKYKQKTGTSSFNVTYACQLPCSLDRLKLVSAWDFVLRRHRILRCRYRGLDSRSLIRDFSLHPPTAKQVEAIDVQAEVNIPFDISRGDELIRVSLSSKYMLVVISHIICDLTTLGILLREVADTYHGSQLAPISKTYFQTRWSVPAMPYQLKFWSQYLDGASQPILSIGNNRMDRKTWAGSSHVCEISQAAHRAMINFASANKVTMHQLAVAAVTLALQHDGQDCDIVIGAPYLNRDSEEDLEVVGLFLEPLPIRIRYPSAIQEYIGSGNSGQCSPLPESDQDSFIRIVQRSSTAALSHALPWDQLVSHLKAEPDFPNHPIFDIMVTFHEAGHRTRFHIKDTQFLPTWGDGAKFKFMAEFTARYNGTVSLRLEYSTECFTGEDVQLMGQLILEALDGLMAGDGYNGTLRRLRAIRNEGASRVILER